MTKKKQRDADAPKRNMSAYLLYQNAMRDQFKALNPGMTFGELAKYTSAMYSELPLSDKEAWVARAEADKARYLHELSSYTVSNNVITGISLFLLTNKAQLTFLFKPPPGYDNKGDAIVSPAITKGRKSKPEKDVNAPKRNMSAYLLYQNAMREQFKRENPGMTFGQLAKYTSLMYKNLTPEEKEAWDSRAQQDKTRYDAEISAYVPPPGHDARGVLYEVQRRPKKRNKKRPKKDPSMPKRPAGAYVFFTNFMRPKVLAEFQGITFVDLGKVMGERWRALPPEEKKRFEDMAAEDKIRFQREMQEYTATRGAGVDPPERERMEHAYYHDTHAVTIGTYEQAYAAPDCVPHHDLMVSKFTIIPEKTLS
jgi:HMG (high mobility group) box